MKLGAPTSSSTLQNVMIYQHIHSGIFTLPPSVLWASATSNLTSEYFSTDVLCLLKLRMRIGKYILLN